MAVKALPTCCLDMEIKVIDLLFPSRMSPEGQEFVAAHGLENMTLEQIRAASYEVGDGVIRLTHRCQKLDDNGRCTIYKSRPAICRTFDCALRHDCACKGKGKIK